MDIPLNLRNRHLTYTAGTTTQQDLLDQVGQMLTNIEPDLKRAWKSSGQDFENFMRIVAKDCSYSADKAFKLFDWRQIGKLLERITAVPGIEIIFEVAREIWLLILLTRQIVQDLKDMSDWQNIIRNIKTAITRSKNVCSNLSRLSEVLVPWLRQYFSGVSDGVIWGAASLIYGISLTTSALIHCIMEETTPTQKVALGVVAMAGIGLIGYGLWTLLGNEKKKDKSGNRY